MSTIKSQLFSTLIIMTVFFISGEIKAAEITPLPPENHSKINEISNNNNNQKSSFSTNSVFSINGGSRFSQNVQVNVDPGNLTSDVEAAIAVSDDGNTIYVVWSDINPATMVQEVHFSRSLDRGATFSTSVKINDDTATPYSAYMPQITIDSNGILYAVWDDYRDPDCAIAVDESCNIDVYFDKSTDGGQSWGTDALVSTNGTGDFPWHFQPKLTVDNSTGNIYVSYSSYLTWWSTGADVFVARSINGGTGFETPVKPYNDVTYIFQVWSSIKVDPSSGDVFVAFHDDRNGDNDIYLAKSSDAGVSFGANVMVNDVTTNDQVEPHLEVDSNGIIYVTWRDWRNDSDPANVPYDNAIYFAKSIDGGSVFESNVMVSDVFSGVDSTYVINPVMKVDGLGEIIVSWHDIREGFSNSYIDHSSDGGVTFSTDRILNDDSQAVSHVLPRIDLDGSGNIYAVFNDERNGNGNSDIFFTRSISVVTNDYNGDRRSDILWRDSTTGMLDIWLMDGTTIASSGSPGTLPGTDWQIKGKADFDGDGKADILEWNSTSGETYIWFMDGLTKLSDGTPGTRSDLNWKIQGIGDFDNDGKADILWHHDTSGEVYIWLMDGLTILSEGSPGTASDLDWQIKGAGDFNGDGKTDILGWHITSGKAYIWFMDGLTVLSEGSPGTAPDLDWQIKGTGDFNGDGNTDILGWHSTSGQTYIWLMDGLTILSGGSPGTEADLDWQIKDTGDFDSDGKSDILWYHNTSGTTDIWLMDGLIKNSSGSPGTVSDLNWQIQ